MNFFWSSRGNCDEAALWNALELVGLKPLVRSFAMGLDHVLSTSADTLSTGERQVAMRFHSLLFVLLLTLVNTAFVSCACIVEQHKSPCA